MAFGTLHGMLVGDQEESAGATGRVDDPVGGRRVDDIDDRPDQVTRGEVLARTRSLVRGALGKQRLIGVTFEICARGRPVLFVDQIDDQAFELRWILNPVLRLAENGAERSRLLREPDEDLRVLDFKISSLGVEQLLPGVFGGNDLLRVELSRRPLVRHLQEEQVRELFGVLDDTDTVVAQHIAVAPKFVDQAAGIRHGGSPSGQLCTTRFGAPR